MAKLVGIIHDDEDNSSAERNKRAKCLARRQLPLTIEQDLTMIMALDDACLACGTFPETNSGSSSKKSNANSSNAGDRSAFLRKYEALSKDEVSAALMVNFEDFSATLTTEVNCVGCRRSVESLLEKLHAYGDSALEPLIITDDKVISVGRDHLLAPVSLANLFCDQLPRLRSTYVEPFLSGGKPRKKTGNGRCASHSLGLKKIVTFGHWLDTWNCMERECQEECVLVHFDVLRSTVDQYLKKHSFCSECTNMVNKAYNLLVQDQDPKERDRQQVSSCCTADESDNHSSPALDGESAKALGNRRDMYKGLTSCVADQHVHVECRTEFVKTLIEMAEPELSGLKQERHAKTIEIAQKEILTCIGICLYERFQRIQQRLREGQQSCDLLFFVALRCLKQSFDVAFESKQGMSEMERLCQELDEEERKKAEKAQKKREKKNLQKAAKKKIIKEKEAAEAEAEDLKSSTSSSSEVVSNNATNTTRIKQSKSTASAKGKMQCSKNNKDKSKENNVKANNVNSNVVVNGGKSNNKDKAKPAISMSDVISASDGPISVLKLASMLDENEVDEEEEEEAGEQLISQDEIQAYLRNVSHQREELRKNLRQRFAQLCVNGL